MNKISAGYKNLSAGFTFDEKAGIMIESLVNSARGAESITYARPMLLCRLLRTVFGGLNGAKNTKPATDFSLSANLK